MDLDNVNTTNTDSDIDMENIQMDNNGSSRKLISKTRAIVLKKPQSIKLSD